MKIIDYILDVPSQEIYSDIRRLFVSMFKSQENNFPSWINNCLQRIPPDCLTNKEKEKYMKDLLKFDEKNAKRVVDIILKRGLNRCFRKITPN
jgi:hypothetical protein